MPSAADSSSVFEAERKRIVSGVLVVTAAGVAVFGALWAVRRGQVAPLGIAVAVAGGLSGLSWLARTRAWNVVLGLCVALVFAGCDLAALASGGLSSQALLGLSLIIGVGAMLFGERGALLTGLGGVGSVLFLLWRDPGPLGLALDAALLPLTIFTVVGVVGVFLSRRLVAVTARLQSQQADLRRTAGRLETEVKLRKHSQLELDGAYRAAMEGVRVKNAFLANMSHELRTPMNAVIGLTDLMLRDELTARQRENLETVRESSQSLLVLLDELLDLSKIEAGAMRLEVVDFAPRDLLAQLSRLFGPRASSQGLAFELRCEARVPAMLKGDPLRLSQVLTNLVMNALKFTAKGRVEVVLDWAVDLLMARVSDTGIGMNPEQVGRVFSAFEQADASMTRRFGGSGLGLAIVKRLCELQGGCITVTSEPGVGSVFTATLAMPEGAGLPVVAPAAPRPSVEGMRVLVAEDNVINQRVAERLLEKLGVSVTIAVNGLEALRAVERGDWTVVLMDLQMPEMDGLEATRRIRELPRAQPVIIAVTANALNEHRTAALEAGVDDFLTKPITLDALASALGRARGGRVSLSA